MVSKAQMKATKKYEKKNYDRVLLRMPKGMKNKILETGAQSINGYIVNLIKRDLGMISDQAEEEEKDFEKLSDFEKMEVFK